MTDNDTSAELKSRQQRFLTVAVACTLAAAALACLFLTPEISNRFADGQGNASGELVARAWNLLATGVLAAVVEELVFRGLLLEALMRVVKANAAVIVSAAAFGILHALPIGVNGTAIGQGTVALEVPAAVALSLKFLQATAFGIAMAGIVTRGGSLLAAIAVHALFDIVYFAVPVLATGDFPSTYAALSGWELAGLLSSTALLAIPAAMTFRTPASGRNR